jgi:hypothetical protein
MDLARTDNAAFQGQLLNAFTQIRTVSWTVRSVRGRCVSPVAQACSGVSPRPVPVPSDAPGQGESRVVPLRVRGWKEPGRIPSGAEQPG